MVPRWKLRPGPATSAKAPSACALKALDTRQKKNPHPRTFWHYNTLKERCGERTYVRGRWTSFGRIWGRTAAVLTLIMQNQIKLIKHPSQFTIKMWRSWHRKATLRFVWGHQEQYQMFHHLLKNAEAWVQFRPLLAFQHSTSSYFMISTSKTNFTNQMIIELKELPCTGY